MIKNNEPYLIEYNIRMGDPECQVLMMRLKTNLVQVVQSVIHDSLKDLKIDWSNNKCMTIVLCSNGYPGKYKKNSEIKNLDKLVMDENNQVFHAGTYEKDKKIFSNGGRVLNITSSEKNLALTRNKCLDNLRIINWKEGFYRKDIGWRVIKEDENNKR